MFSFFCSGLNWQAAAAFCFVGCFWGPVFILNAVTTSELSWVSPGVGEQGVQLCPRWVWSSQCGVLRGERRGARAVHHLPVQGRHSLSWGPVQRPVWWSFGQRKSLFVLCESVTFLFPCRLYVCEDDHKSWHHLAVSVAALEPELTSSHHPGRVSAPGALPQERHKIFPENQSAQSYLITIILNAQ